MMKVIEKLETTDTRPEEMRVVFEDGWFLVQTKSRSGIWITQKEHKTEAAAVADMRDWY